MTPRFLCGKAGEGERGDMLGQPISLILVLCPKAGVGRDLTPHTAPGSGISTTEGYPDGRILISVGCELI